MPKKASRGFDKLKRWVSDLSSAELEGLTGALTAHAIPQQFAKPLVRSSRPHGQSTAHSQLTDWCAGSTARVRLRLGTAAPGGA